MAKSDKATLKQIEYHLAAKNYVDYVQLVHDGLWLRSRFGRFLCDEIQEYIKNQLKEDQIAEQLELEIEDPFKKKG